MSKINLPNVTSSFNVTRINDNFQEIAEHLNDKALYRNNPVGEPNAMKSPLDMDSNRIYNLPEPIADHEAARKKDIGNAPLLAKQYAEEAKDWSEAAEETFNDVVDVLLEGTDYLGEYLPDLVIDSPLQFFWRDDAYYRISGDIELPYTTTGDWGAEEGLFVVVGDGLLREELAQPNGSSKVGYKNTDVYGKLSETASLLDYIPKSQHAAIKDKTSNYDATADIAAALLESNGRTLIIPDGRFVGLWNLSGWSGTIVCYGEVATVEGSNFAFATMSGASNIDWIGGVVDLRQSMATGPTTPRTEVGFHLYNSRNINFFNTEIINVRVGRPWIIDGSSSVNNPSPEMGSRNITLDSCKCIALPYTDIDQGTSITIRSEFYTGDGGGSIAPASNGVRLSDFEFDASLSMARTTSDITFINCEFENHDRMALLNCKNVTFIGTKLNNFYTRGLACSPSVENVTFSGGILSGRAAFAVANYRCKNIIVSDAQVINEVATAGQGTGIVVGHGSTDCSFTNIHGNGGHHEHILIEGAKNISFTNVNLSHKGEAPHRTSHGISVSGGGILSPDTTYTTENITLTNCYLEAIYGINFNKRAGVFSVATGGITLDKTKISASRLFFEPQPQNGQVKWLHSEMKDYTSSESLSPRAFSYIDGVLPMIMHAEVVLNSNNTDVVFPIYFLSSKLRPGGTHNSERNAKISVYYRDPTMPTMFWPLVQGIHYTLLNDGMINGIRNSSSYPAGSVFRIRRDN